jgi:hypothetical protein
MKRHQSLWITAAWCAFVPIAGLSVWAAEQPRKLAPPAAGPAAPADTASDDEMSEADLLKAFRRLEVQSAQAYVKLTELDLQKITQMNEKMSGVYSTSEVDNLKLTVDIARERVRVAQEAVDGNKESSLVGIAALRMRNAQQVYERALNANKRLATAYGQIDLERLRVAVDSARVDLDKAKVVARMNSPLTDLHLELDELREEVRQLRYRITAITSRR